MSIMIRLVTLFVFIGFGLGLPGRLAVAVEKRDPYAIPPGPVEIHQDRAGRVLFVVTGKQGSVRTLSKAGVHTLLQGSVGGLTVAPNGDVWVDANGRQLLYPKGNWEARPVDRTASFQCSGDANRPFAARDGRVWFSGGRQLMTAARQFSTRPNSDGWRVVAGCDDSYGNVWGVASKSDARDLAVLNSKQPHNWRRLGLPKELLRSVLGPPIVDDVGGVWVATPQSVIRIDPQYRRRFQVIRAASKSRVTAVARVANEQICVGFSDGSIQRLAYQGGKPSWHSIIKPKFKPIRALLHDRRGKLWFVAGDQIRVSAALKQPWQESWDELPRMPAGNHDHIFAQVGDRLFTAGGKTYFGWPAGKWVNLDHVWSYHIPTRTWRVEPPMLEPGKSYSGIAALDSEIWLLGGYFRTNTRRGITATATVEIYNPQTRRYRRGPKLPGARGQVVALVAGKRIYAIGGASDTAVLAEVLSIGRGESKWRKEPALPAPVQQASGCELDGKFYVAAPGGAGCKGLYVFDVAKRKWSQIERSGTTAPQAPLCTAHRGEVWVLGGLRKSGGQTSSSIYSPKTGKWRAGPVIPLPVSWGAAASVDGRLLISGGAYREPRVKDYFNSDRVFLLRESQAD